MISCNNPGNSPLTIGLMKLRTMDMALVTKARCEVLPKEDQGKAIAICH